MCCVWDIKRGFQCSVATRIIVMSSAGNSFHQHSDCPNKVFSWPVLSHIVKQIADTTMVYRRRQSFLGKGLSRQVFFPFHHLYSIWHWISRDHERNVVPSLLSQVKGHRQDSWAGVGGSVLIYQVIKPINGIVLLPHVHSISLELSSNFACVGTPRPMSFWRWEYGVQGIQ